MREPSTNTSISPATLRRAGELFAGHQQTIYKHTDRLFAVLMTVQWFAGIAAALWIAPQTWIGSASQTHIHVWAAILLGGAINIVPIALAVKRPGAPATRYTIAMGQMMMSALLIHLTGGRIETHFHVFGSLAFLAFYRDWRVLLPATAVVAADHFLRGVFWPESVYGVLSVSQWRWLEHAGWVLFEDAVLFVAIKRSVSEMWDIALQTARTNDLNESLEQRVADRTAEVVSINQGLQKEITEREIAESALRYSEEEHRSIFDNATMGIYRSTVDGKLIKANNAFAKMLGYDSVEEILECDLERDVYYYPEQRAALIAERYPSGSADGLEILWKRKDGSPIWVHLNASPVTDDSGNTICFDTCIHDVTERVQAEEALRDSERRFAQAFNASPQPMSIATLDEGRYIDINESFVSVSGYGREELIGRTSVELNIWPNQDARQQLVDRLIDQTSVRNMETQLCTKSGDVRVLLSSAEVVELDGERCLLIASSDITDRKLAEQSLQEANQRALRDYEQLVERIATLGQTLGNARDLTTIFRALTDFAVVSAPCDGLVISLYDHEKQTRSAAYCWTDQQEFDPKKVADISVRDGMTGRAIKSGTVVIDNDFQKALRAKKGVMVGECADDRIPRSALSAPMTVMGRTVGCVEVQSYQPGAYQQEHATAMRMAANLAATALENVTLIEREQAKEEQLRQSQKMEAVGQLAGGIAHDFNNLLTAITGYSELTLRELNEDSPLYSKVTEIKKAGDRAASLTRQLLAFSRKQILQPKVLDLNAVLPDMERMLRRVIGEDISLRTVLDSSLGQVKADPGQIEQIVMNLCVNARDAMADGGHLTIETSNVHLEQSYRNQQVVIRPGHYVMLSVSDNGCGMNADTQAHIFEPFYTTKELGKGTGLGLSTVYGIVKQSEGSIWVYSEVGKGTTFKIYLPRVDEVQKRERAETAREVLTGNETILLVEDEDIVRTLSTEILQQHGYTVIAAANGEEGLRVCKEFEGTIDLMITDVVMPRMSGRELAEHVFALRPETRVLYMSGFTDDAIVRHGVLDDGVFFIQKPFSPDSLAIKAREILDQIVNPPANQSGIGLDERLKGTQEELNHGYAPVN
jgi:PAS domain S-box-containing protein